MKSFGLVTACIDLLGNAPEYDFTPEMYFADQSHDIHIVTHTHTPILHPKNRNCPTWISFQVCRIPILCSFREFILTLELPHTYNLHNSQVSFGLKSPKNLFRTLNESCRTNWWDAPKHTHTQFTSQQG